MVQGEGPDGGAADDDPDDDPVDGATAVSDWIEVGQDLIDGFADLTEDWTAIHLDPAAARAAGLPGTIAHGFLLVSLLAPMLEDSGLFAGRRLGMNYGLDSLRFCAPVAAGSRIRGRFCIAEEIDAPKGRRVVVDVTVERDTPPATVAAARWLLLVMD